MRNCAGDRLTAICSGLAYAGKEICDSVDNVCDGLTDDSDSSLSLSGRTTYYRDSDSDGYGTSTFTTAACAGFTCVPRQSTVDVFAGLPCSTAQSCINATAG